ncbi:hypothetical protein BESB_009010 [Besnoitia besnoiti]|uniref:Uncharacterized protein n=1 Tax=Besnoitia besnoiti TaxID=94643 RepID=A0A2A9MKS8_BESBE|nr:hypothetical protein BESB_009010 [Besnoitia besnoiti]PFH38559.1 hypothetical protein BESB_009010 [Besnoitia besnoiti]
MASQTSSARSPWKRHFETARERATLSANRYLQSSSSVVLSNQSRLSSLRGSASRTNETALLSAAHMARQNKFRAVDDGTPRHTGAGGPSSQSDCVSNSTTVATSAAGNREFLSFEEVKALTRFEGSESDYIPPKLNQEGIMSGGQTSRVTSQMERQLECVTVVRNLRKAEDTLERTVEMPAYITRSPAVQLGLEPVDFGDLKSTQRKEIEDSKMSLKNLDATKNRSTWPPKDEIPTLVHHNPSRNPLTQFAKLKHPIENREPADGWRGPVLPSLGSGLRYSEWSGMNAGDSSSAVAAWFMHKKSHEDRDEAGPKEPPGFLALLRNISEDPMQMKVPKKCPPPSKTVNTQAVSLTGGLLDIGDVSAKRATLTAVVKPRLKGSMRTVFLDDAAAAADHPRPCKPKSEKEAAVQTEPPAAPAKPAAREITPQRLLTSASKLLRVSRKQTRFASAATSSSSDSDESSSGTHAHATPSYGAARPASDGAPGSQQPAAAPAAEARHRGALTAASKKPKQATEEEKRAAAEQKARERYIEYVNLLNCFPGRALPNLKSEQDDVSDEPVQPQGFGFPTYYPPWAYVAEPVNAHSGAVGMLASAVPRVEVPILQGHTAAQEGESEDPDLSAAGLLEVPLMNLFFPGFDEFLYPGYDPNGAAPVAIPMIHMLPESPDVWENAVADAVRDEWRRAQREWEDLQRAQATAYKTAEAKARQRREKAIRRKQLAERKSDSDVEIQRTQRRLKTEIQHEYAEFVSTRGLLQRSMHQPLSRGAAAIGNCRGGKRAWTVFDRSTRTEATRRSQASSSYAMLPEEDDLFDTVPPPRRGRQVGARMTRGRRPRAPGGYSGTLHAPVSFRGADVLNAIGEPTKERGADSLTDRPVESSQVESLTSGEDVLERVEFERGRQRELDRMLDDLEPKLSRPLQRSVALRQRAARRASQRLPDTGEERPGDLAITAHGLRLKQRLQESEVAIKIKKTSGLVASGVVPPDVKELLLQGSGPRHSSSAEGRNEVAFVGLLGSPNPQGGILSTARDSKARVSNGGLLIGQAFPLKAVSAEPANFATATGTGPLQPNRRPSQESEPPSSDVLAQRPTPREASSDFEQERRMQRAFSPLPTFGRQLDTGDDEQHDGGEEVPTSQGGKGLIAEAAKSRARHPLTPNGGPVSQMGGRCYDTQQSRTMDSQPFCRQNAYSEPSLKNEITREDQEEVDPAENDKFLPNCEGISRSAETLSPRSSTSDGGAERRHTFRRCKPHGVGLAADALVSMNDEDLQTGEHYAEHRSFRKANSFFEARFAGQTDSPRSPSGYCNRTSQGQRPATEEQECSLPPETAGLDDEVNPHGGDINRFSLCGRKGELGRLHAAEEGQGLKTCWRAREVGASNRDLAAIPPASTTYDAEFYRRSQLLYKKYPHLRTLFTPPSTQEAHRPSKFPWDDEVIPTCRQGGSVSAYDDEHPSMNSRDDRSESSAVTQEKPEFPTIDSTSTGCSSLSNEETSFLDGSSNHRSFQSEKRPFLRRGLGQGGGRYRKDAGSGRKCPTGKSGILQRNKSVSDSSAYEETISFSENNPLEEHEGESRIRRAPSRPRKYSTVSMSKVTDDSLVTWSGLWPAARSFYRSSDLFCQRDNMSSKRLSIDRNPVVCLDDEAESSRDTDVPKKHPFLKKGGGRNAGQGKKREEYALSSAGSTPRRLQCTSPTRTVGRRAEKSDTEVHSAGERRTRVRWRFEEKQKSHSVSACESKTSSTQSCISPRCSSTREEKRAGRSDKVPYTLLMDLSSHFLRPRVRWGHPLTQTFFED